MIKLRAPQNGCSDAIFDSLIAGKNNILGVMAGGTGKAYVLCDIMKRLDAAHKGIRILQLVHTRELIEQNYKSMLKYWPGAPCGINSAGLGARDYNSQMIFGGIQSLYKKSKDIGEVHILGIDEAQLIGRDANSMYGQMITDLRERNPKMAIFGLTATAFRTTCGWLHKGEDALFSEIVYDYGIGAAINDGYLTPPRSKSADFQYDLSGVRKNSKEFIISQMANAIDVDAKTKSAVAETIAYAEKNGLKKWIVFGAGQKHCENICAELRRQGVSAESLTGNNTRGAKRDAIFMAHKRGIITALLNVNIATIGYDDPEVDFIVWMRATNSPGLYHQGCVRGDRLIDPAIGNLPTAQERLAAIASSAKPHFHVLDFGGNHRNGTLDEPVVHDKRTSGLGDAPVKICPECKEILATSVRVCPACEYEYPESDPNIESTASTEVLLSSQREPKWLDVTNVEYSLHRSRKSGNDSMKVTYWCGIGQYYKEWITMRHPSGRNWWAFREPGVSLPQSVTEMIKRAPGLPKPARVQVVKQGEHWQVVGYG